MDQNKRSLLSSRRIFLKRLGMVCLGFAPFLQACDHLNARSEYMEAIAKTDMIPRMVKPPIDLTAPAKTEMATFALG